MGEIESPGNERTLVIRKRGKPLSLRNVTQKDLIKMAMISIKTGIKFPIDGDNNTVTPEIPITTSEDIVKKLDK